MNIKHKKMFFWLVLISVLLFMLGPLVYNNVLLTRYANQLYSIPLPNESFLITQNKAVGNLFGTGDHLDFVASMEIECLLSESELEDYYAKFKCIKSVNELSILGMDTTYFDVNIDHSMQRIEVIPKNQSAFCVGSSKVFCKTNIIDENINPDLFIVQIKDTHYDANWDFRAY